MKERIDPQFYRLHAPEAAPLLLGKLLCRRIDGEILRRRITETECYYSEKDTACHAHRGRTPRTDLLYRPGGIAYVYLCYGIHSLFNVITGEENFPEGVLIRGIEGCSGPGRVTRFLSIDRSLNGIDLITSDQLWIEDDGFRPRYRTDKRVGIGYASEEDQNRPWRFILEENS